MQTIENTYPACFAGLNLDQINQALAQGLASEADARNYIAWHNTSGKRSTVAGLGTRSKPLGNARIVIPYVFLSEQSREAWHKEQAQFYADKFA